MKTHMSAIGLLAALAFAPFVGAQTNIQMNLGMRGTPPPIPFIHDAPVSIFQTALDRIDERSEHRLQKFVFERIVSDSEEDIESIDARRGRSLVSEGFKYSLKEYWGDTPLKLRLEEMKDWFFGESDSGTKMSLRMSGGYRGLRITQNEKLDPFREDPYLRIKWTLENNEREFAESSIRFGMDLWQEPELLYELRIPLSSWHMGFRAEYRFSGDEEREIEHHGRLFTEVDNALRASIGLARRVGNGLVRFQYEMLSKQSLAMLSIAY